MKDAAINLRRDGCINVGWIRLYCVAIKRHPTKKYRMSLSRDTR